MDFLSMFNQLKETDALEELSRKSNTDKNGVSKVVEMGIPTLLQAMQNNVKSDDGAKSLAKALDDHQDDDVDDLLGFLKKSDKDEGSKILEHVFGARTATVGKKISSSTGVQAPAVSSILAQLAPMVLGVLGQQKKKQNVDANGLSSMIPMLSSLLNSSSSKDLTKMASSLLDSDKDGSIMDDVGDLVKGFFKK